MVRIEAIVRPSKLNEVKNALNEIGVTSISVIEIRGAGKQKGYTQHYRGSEYQVNLLPKLQIIVVVPQSQQEPVIGAIESAARTGEIGDGKIFISNVDEAIESYGRAWRYGCLIDGPEPPSMRNAMDAHKVVSNR